MALAERTVLVAMAGENRRNERRAFKRWSVIIPGRCYGPWGSSQMVITEISEAGVHLTWPKTANPGDEITIAWQLDDGPPLQITSVVRCASQQGVGVEFLDATLSDRLRIVAYLKNTLKNQ